MKKTVVIILLILTAYSVSAQSNSLEYEKIRKILPSKATTSQYISIIAKYFIDRPYTAGLLDDYTGNEKIIVTLREFDCVTFQETCLAIARDAQSSRPSYSNFLKEIETIRYRNGINKGYCSRLHYSTDWINNNTLRQIADDITPQLGGITTPNYINFMSTHASLYRHLKDNQAATDSIRQQEHWLNNHHTTYIPKNEIASIASKIKSGSLIFITTSTQGLDYAHVGIAINENGILKMIHASSTAHKVTTTPTSLANYLSTIKKFTGITILEPR